MSRYLKNRRIVSMGTALGDDLSIKEITTAIEQVPDECKDSVRFVVEEYDTCVSTSTRIALSYTRYETKEEYEQRAASEAQTQNKNKEERQKLYEALKREFEK